MKIQASLKIMPAGNCQKEVYNNVNEAIATIATSGLKYVVGSSETTIEGEYNEIFQLIEKIHNMLVLKEVRQITMIIVTDYNIESTYIDEKINNVNDFLNRGV